MKKYELTAESIVKYGRTLYRIKALKAFGDVRKGELGGFVEKEENLDQEGSAWVSGNAAVCENAWVSGNAWVRGNAVVCGYATVWGNAVVRGNAVVYGYATVSGNAWVRGNAVVRENAVVCGYATVWGNAVVRGSAVIGGNATVGGSAVVFKTSHYLAVGPIGSRDGFTTFFRTKHLTIGVKCGCFTGDMDKFLAAVDRTHGNNKHAQAYRAAAHLAELQIDLSKEDDDEEEE